MLSNIRPLSVMSLEGLTFGSAAQATNSNALSRLTVQPSSSFYCTATSHQVPGGGAAPDVTKHTVTSLPNLKIDLTIEWNGAFRFPGMRLVRAKDFERRLVKLLTGETEYSPMKGDFAAYLRNNPDDRNALIDEAVQASVATEKPLEVVVTHEAEITRWGEWVIRDGAIVTLNESGVPSSKRPSKPEAQSQTEPPAREEPTWSSVAKEIFYLRSEAQRTFEFNPAALTAANELLGHLQNANRDILTPQKIQETLEAIREGLAQSDPGLSRAWKMWREISGRRDSVSDKIAALSLEDFEKVVTKASQGDSSSIDQLRDAALLGNIGALGGLARAAEASQEAEAALASVHQSTDPGVQKAFSRAKTILNHIRHISASSRPHCDLSLGLLRQRLGRLDNENEADADFDKRKIVSKAKAYEQSMMNSLRTKMIISPTTAKITDLRNDLVLGLISHIAQETANGYRRSRHNPDLVFRVNADLVYKNPLEWLDAIFIDNSELDFRLDRPIDVDTLVSLFKTSKFAFEFQKSSSGESTAILYEGRHLLTINPYHISVPYRQLVSDAAHLNEAIELATRAIEAIHQDTLISREYQVVRLSELGNFAEALLGLKSKPHFTTLGGYARTHLNRLGDNSRNSPFRETRRSITARNRSRAGQMPAPMYLLKSENFGYPPHVDYILIEGSEKRPMLIGWNMSLIDREFEAFLNTAGDDISFERVLVEGLGQSGSRFNRKRYEYHVFRKVDGESQPLMNFSAQTVKIPILQKPESLNRAMELLDRLYDTKPFEVGTHNVGRIQAGMTPIEASLLETWNLLKKLWNLFVRDELEAKAIDREMNHNAPYEAVPPPQVWMAQQMAESEMQTQEGRLLHLLTVIRSHVTPRWAAIHPAEVKTLEAQIEAMKAIN